MPASVLYVAGKDPLAEVAGGHWLLQYDEAGDPRTAWARDRPPSAGRIDVGAPAG